MDKNQSIIFPFGERLRKMRESRGLSREKLVEEMARCGAGVHYKTIASWEKNDTCKMEHIPVLCSILDCDTEYLFGRSPTPHKETADVMMETGLSQKAVDALRSTEHTVELCALNAILESKEAGRFLSEFYFYVFGSYRWATLRGVNKFTGRISDESCDVDEREFRFEVYEKESAIHEEYDSKEFVKMLQDSKMTRIQEILSDIRKEARKGAEGHGECKTEQE